MKNLSLFSLSFFLVFLFGCREKESVEISDTESTKNQYEMTLQEARAEVENLLVQIDGETRADGKVRKIVNCHRIVEKGFTRTVESVCDDECVVYVFNFENEEGYALVLGDKRIYSPVLIMTDKGYLDSNTKVSNPGLINYLAMAEAYRKHELAEYEKNRVSQHISDTRIDINYSEWVWDGDWYVKELLGKRTYLNWHQGKPFNDNIPMIDGKRPPLGCTATATMLLMAWYQYPQVYNGHRFNWTEMLKHRNEKTNNDHMNPLAYSDLALLGEIITRPENLDMDFDLEGSGAWLYNVPRTLERLGYFHGGTHGEWSAKIALDELGEYPYYPVMVTGYAIKNTTRNEMSGSEKILGINIEAPQGVYYSKGHTFLVESAMIRERKIKYVHPNVTTSNTTRSETLVYVNYGWGDDSNGYYNAGVFNTVAGPVTRSQTGTDYNYQYNLTMLYGVRI
ncbi:C10 family peptidase [uncultured Alistipes sp.]|uniref:C10 family peptidase n=1 Tax=uncultured Alistipes sp. TaxID=538949 RepID=UPI002618D009|nr:C10 family peptidase [uncultured Alistipes sp.]